MIQDKSTASRQLRLALRLLLDVIAGGVCFAVLFGAPVLLAGLGMMLSNDPGGPLFLPMVVVGSALFSAMVAGAFTAVTVLTDVARNFRRIPQWVSPIVVGLLSGTGASVFGEPQNAIAVAIFAGVVGIVVFSVHCAAIWTVWFLGCRAFDLLQALLRTVNRSGAKQGS